MVLRGKEKPVRFLFFPAFIQSRMGYAGQEPGYGADPHCHEHALGIAKKIAESPQRSAYEYSPGDTLC